MWDLPNRQAGLAILFTGVFITLLEPLAQADIRPETVHVADMKKTKSYIRDGLIVGGDQQIDGVTVLDIRRAANKGFDRIVIDLETTQQGVPPKIQRPPYYQIAVTPDERRLVLSLFGKPKLRFNAKKVLSTFKHSAVIESVGLLPPLEDDVWTFVLELKSDSPVEVFELSNPVRIIVDIEQGRSNKPILMNSSVLEKDKEKSSDKAEEKSEQPHWKETKPVRASTRFPKEEPEPQADSHLEKELPKKAKWESAKPAHDEASEESAHH